MKDDKIKVTAQFRPEEVKFLEYCKDQMGASTTSEALRRMVRIYRTLIMEHNAGWDLTMEKEGDKRSILLLI